MIWQTVYLDKLARAVIMLAIQNKDGVSEEIKEDFVDMLKPSEATTDEEKWLEEVINAKQHVCYKSRRKF